MGRTAAQALANRSQDPIFKINRAKLSGGAVHVVEPLPCKCETLSSNPSPAKKKKRKKRTDGISEAIRASQGIGTRSQASKPSGINTFNVYNAFHRRTPS
jgi:hypothetical protein